MSKYTPSPWNVIAYDIPGTYTITEAICRTTPTNTPEYPIQQKEHAANAALISASPDLYEACKRVLDELKEGLTTGCVEDLRSAIKKAEGLSKD